MARHRLVYLYVYTSERIDLPFDVDSEIIIIIIAIERVICLKHLGELDDTPQC